MPESSIDTRLYGKNQIAYVELPTAEIQSLKAFYTKMFGWSFLELGEDYAVFQNAGIDGGINPNKNDRTNPAFPEIIGDENSFFPGVAAGRGLSDDEIPF